VYGSWRRVQSVCGPRHGSPALYGQLALNELLASINTHSVATGGLPQLSAAGWLPSILTCPFRRAEEKEMLLRDGVIDGQAGLFQTVANVRTGQSEQIYVDWDLSRDSDFGPRRYN
jgi:hypothetical protein